MASRSLDLMPCVFFLWGWAKEQVYRRKPRNLEQLEETITDVLTNIPEDMLHQQ
jgi:hypothetical protein